LFSVLIDICCMAVGVEMRRFCFSAISRILDGDACCALTDTMLKALWDSRAMKNTSDVGHISAIDIFRVVLCKASCACSLPFSLLFAHHDLSPRWILKRARLAWRKHVLQQPSVGRAEKYLPLINQVYSELGLRSKSDSKRSGALRLLKYIASLEPRFVASFVLVYAWKFLHTPQEDNEDAFYEVRAALLGIQGVSEALVHLFSHQTGWTCDATHAIADMSGTDSSKESENRTILDTAQPSAEDTDQYHETGQTWPQEKVICAGLGHNNAVREVFDASAGQNRASEAAAALPSSDQQRSYSDLAEPAREICTGPEVLLGLMTAPEDCERPDLLLEQSMCRELLQVVVRAARVNGLSPVVEETLDAVLNRIFPSQELTGHIRRQLMALGAINGSDDATLRTREERPSQKEVNDTWAVIKSVIEVSSRGNGWVLELLTPFLVSSLTSQMCTATAVHHSHESHPLLDFCALLQAQHPRLAVSLMSCGFGITVLNCAERDPGSCRLFGRAVHDLIRAPRRLNQYSARLFIQGIATNNEGIRALVTDALSHLIPEAAYLPPGPPYLDLLMQQNISIVSEFMCALLLASNDADLFTANVARQIMHRCNVKAHLLPVLDECVQELVSLHLNAISLSRQSAAATALSQCILLLPPSRTSQAVDALLDAYDKHVWQKQEPAADSRWMLAAKGPSVHASVGVLSKYNIPGLEKKPVRLHDMDLSVLQCRKRDKVHVDGNWRLRLGVALALKELASSIGRKRGLLTRVRSSGEVTVKAPRSADCSTREVDHDAECLRKVFSWLLSGPVTDSNGDVAHRMTEAACAVVDAAGPGEAPCMFQLFQESGLGCRDANKTCADNSTVTSTLILGGLAAFFDAADARLVPVVRRLMSSMNSHAEHALLIQARSLALLAAPLVASYAEPLHLWQELCDSALSATSLDRRARAFALAGVVAGAGGSLVRSWRVWETLHEWLGAEESDKGGSRVDAPSRVGDPLEFRGSAPSPTAPMQLERIDACITAARRGTAISVLNAFVLLKPHGIDGVHDGVPRSHGPTLQDPPSPSAGHVPSPPADHVPSPHADHIYDDACFAKDPPGYGLGRVAEAHVVHLLPQVLTLAGDGGGVGPAVRSCCTAVADALSVSGCRFAVAACLEVLSATKNLPCKACLASLDDCTDSNLPTHISIHRHADTRPP
jgi:hypothetical protein